jgi:hypothetical protein
MARKSPDKQYNRQTPFYFMRLSLKVFFVMSTVNLLITIQIFKRYLTHGHDETGSIFT